ncbi:MAG TPA: TolC family protein [Bacillota bacterium]|nr:TolC family protein [Bacillota bacterium]
MSTQRRPNPPWLRKIIATACALAIITISPTTTAFSFSASASATKLEPQGIEVSLEECRSLALEHSASMLLAESAVEDAKLSLEQTEATNLTKPSPTSLYQAKMSLESASKNLEITKQDVILSTDQLYYSLLRAEHLVSISEQALALAERQFEIAVAKETVGMATKLDIMRAENQTASARNSLQSAILSRDLAMVTLNQAIGFDSETILSLRDEFSYEKTGEPDLNASIELALANRVEMAQARSAVEIADMNVKLLDNNFTPRLTYERAKLAAADARVKFAEQQSKIALAVRQAYVALKQAEAKVELAGSKVSEARENLRITQLLFEADMATNVEVLSAQNQYTQSQIDAIQAIYDYNITRSQFKRAIGDTAGLPGGVSEP